jgi:hypothetical protein
MDKSTLSNYGWIIIVTLILAVMLALATPFGTYVGDGVVAVANSFVQSADTAMDEDNIDTMKSQWEGKFDYEAVKSDEYNLNHSGVVPNGTIYVTGIQRISCNNCDPYSHWCWCNTTTYNAGDKFPSTVNSHDLYIYDDYVYMYKASNAYQRGGGCPYTIEIDGVGTFRGFYSDSSCEGWGVALNHAVDGIYEKQSLCPILETINGKPITSLVGTFYCSNIITAPKIPSGVTNMGNAFYGCTALTTAPKIPAGVTDMSYTFYNCSNLTGTIIIDANPTNYNYCFDLYENGKSITLTGSSTTLQELANTSNSSKRTITIQ